MGEARTWIPSLMSAIGMRFQYWRTPPSRWGRSTKTSTSARAARFPPFRSMATRSLPPAAGHGGQSPFLVDAGPGSRRRLRALGARLQLSPRQRARRDRTGTAASAQRAGPAAPRGVLPLLSSIGGAARSRADASAIMGVSYQLALLLSDPPGSLRRNARRRHERPRGREHRVAAGMEADALAAFVAQSRVLGRVRRRGALCRGNLSSELKQHDRR